MKKYKVILTCEAAFETTVFADSPEEAEEIAKEEASDNTEWELETDDIDIDITISDEDIPQECCGNCINYISDQQLCKIAGVPDDKSPYHTCCLYEPKEGGLA